MYLRKSIVLNQYRLEFKIGINYLFFHLHFNNQFYFYKSRRQSINYNEYKYIKEGKIYYYFIKIKYEYAFTTISSIVHIKKNRTVLRLNLKI